MPGTPCPPADELTAFHNGGLPVAELERVAAHIEGCPSCEAALANLDADEASVAAALRGGPELGDAPIDDLAGTLIAGRYKLIELLGEGGMGCVWMAQQIEPVRRIVAVKLILAGMDSKSVLARFEAERQALALMDHPNIAKVLDAGTTPDGGPFFAMELVKGVPITQFCDERNLTPRERLELFVPVCQAVQHAHQKGIIHRDVKPSNVLVALYDGRPVPKVIDFGIAKATGQPLTKRTLVTGFGAIVGTPAYMAPEQAELNQLDIDTRADVYSLGVLLYELLTGSTPLTQQRMSEAALMEILRLVREEEPPRPSTRLSTADALPAIAARRSTEPRRLTALVRGELDWIVMRALEKDRVRRYETANGLARDLQRYLADEPVEAGPPGIRYRVRKFVRRHRRAVLTAGLVLAAIVAGGGVSVWQAVRATAAEGQALQRERETKTALGTARAVETFMRDVFAQASASGQASPTRTVKRDLTVGEAMDFAARTVGERMAGQPEVEAAIRHAIGATYRDLGVFPEAAAQLERALAIRRSVLGDIHYDTLTTADELGIVYVSTQRVAEAEALFNEALAGLRTTAGEDDRETLNVTHNLGVLYSSQARYPEAERMYERAIAGRRRTQGPTDKATLNSVVGLGNVRRYQGRLTESEELFKEALAGRRATMGNDHPVTLASVSNLGSLYLGQGRLAEAEPLFKEAYAGYRRIRTGPHPEVMGSTGNLAELYVYMNRLADAEPLFREAYEGYQKLYNGALNRDTLRLANNLGKLYLEMGRVADAEPLLVEALEGRRRAFQQPGHRDVLASLEVLAELRLRQGKLAEAEQLCGDAIREYEKQPGQAVRLAMVRESLGQTLLRKGDLPAAKAVLKQAYDALSTQESLAAWQKDNLRKAIDGLIEASERTGDAAEVARWREEQKKHASATR